MTKTFLAVYNAFAMRMFLLAAGTFAILSTNFQRLHLSHDKEQYAMEPNLPVEYSKQSILEVAGTSSVILSGENYIYYYPRRFANATKPKPPLVVTGILSAMKNKVERNLIRNTWGSFMEPKSVLFLVASQNPSAEWLQEMAEFQDLLVLDANEVYDGSATILPQKVQAFFHAAETVLPKSKYIFKTDDDTFVHPHRLKTALRNRRPNYWGYKWKDSIVIRNATHKWYVSNETYPHERYPEYCAGAGYIMSRYFVRCAVKHLADTPFMPMEDVGTGILAKKCNITAKHSNGVFDNDWNFNYDRMILKHRLKNHKIMLQFWEKLRKAPNEDRFQGPPAQQRKQNVTFAGGNKTEEFVGNETSWEQFWWKKKCRERRWKDSNICRVWKAKWGW